MKKNYLIELFFLSMLIGCSSMNAKYQVPIPKDHAKAEQKLLQSSKHWDIIAEDVAIQSIDALNNKGLLKMPMTLKSHGNPSIFHQSLNNFITTHLVNKGAVISAHPEINKIFDKIQIEHDIQVVKFKSERTNRRKSDYLPGQYTVQSLGLVTLYNAVTRWSSDSLKAGFIGIGVARDAIANSERNDDSLLEIPNVEVIVHSSIIKDGTYIMRKSNVYYFNEPDKSLYNQISKTVNVVAQ